MHEATAISFDLLQSCPRGPMLLPRAHDITYIINNYNTHTDGWTDGHSHDGVLLKVNTSPLSHPCFLHSQFISISIPSPGGKVKAGRAMSKEHFLLLNKQNPHYSTTVRFSCQAHFCSLCSSYWDHIFKFLEKGITNPSSS